MMNLPDRLYSQYRRKPKLVDWMNIARTLGGDIESAAEAVRNSYDIDSATGEQLDVLARIVVVDRGFVSNIQLEPALFEDDEDGCQMGDPDAIMSAITASTDSTMSDGLLRIAIKAKIAKNNGDATIKSILNQVQIIAPDLDYISVLDGQDMTFSIEFSGDIEPLIEWALFNSDLIQRPQGVRFLGFSKLEYEYFFAEDDDADLMGDTDVSF
ncbi:DUF2612 domain-containing protein [uncultured Methylophaga sp.]|uniref:DUF2612 domain-containing protein n=1 Tax=uncultured Methylophaga sp. TaxID=285271 RepID=UPI0030F68C15